MMCWSWIDSSCKREALTISCPGPGIASLGGAWTKNREINPMQSRMAPGPQHSSALGPGAREEKSPNLIPSRFNRGHDIASADLGDIAVDKAFLHAFHLAPVDGLGAGVVAVREEFCFHR